MKYLPLLLAGAIASCTQPKNSEQQSGGLPKPQEIVSNANPYVFGDIDKTQLVAIEDAIQSLESSEDTSLVFTTQSVVAGVCEMMGCWMSIPTESGQEVRITFADIKKVVPKDIIGDSVFVSGSLLKKKLSVDMRRHLLMDRGYSADEAAQMVARDTTEYALIADAVEIIHK